MRPGLYFVAALAWALGSKAWADGACRSPEGCQYFLRIEGQFSEAGNVPAESVRVLNEDFEKAVLQATKVLRLKTSRDDKQFLSFKARAAREVDTLFEVNYRAGPGATLEVSARSLSRPDGPWGRVQASVPIVPRAQWQRTALKSRVMRGTSQALEAWAHETEVAKGKTGQRLGIGVLLNGLGTQEQSYVENVLLPCLRSLYRTPVGSSPDVRHLAGYLEYGFTYLPGPKEEPLKLPAHLDKLQSATLDGECAFAGTPLRGHWPEWAVDDLNRGLRLQLRPRR